MYITKVIYVILYCTVQYTILYARVCAALSQMFVESHINKLNTVHIPEYCTVHSAYCVYAHINTRNTLHNGQIHLLSNDPVDPPIYILYF